VPGDARGIHEALIKAFGQNSVFMDIDNLRAGQRFDRELTKALDTCQIFIAIIGPRWIDLLNSRIEMLERDYVREEIAAAVTRGITVIPVRVGREGDMPLLPKREKLPQDIRDLVLHQKHDVAHERFGRDVAELVEVIKTTNTAARTRMFLSGWRAGTILGFVTIIVAIGVSWFFLKQPNLTPTPTMPADTAVNQPSNTENKARRTPLDDNEALRSWADRMNTLKVTQVAPHLYVTSLCQGCKIAAFYCKTPIKSVSELAGKKARITASQDAFTKQLIAKGITPTILPTPEIFSALQAGVIDCIAFQS
jgi:hypothetical protein